MRLSLTRLLLVAAVVACAVAGCEKLFGDGYTWAKIGPPASGYSWRLVSSEDMAKAGCSGFAACALYKFEGGHCEVISIYLEVDAKKRITNGRSLFDHEVGPLNPDGSINGTKGYGHCAGYLHTEKHIRRV